MKVLKIVFGVLAVLALLILLDFGFGYVGVFKTQTVGKAQQDAERQVFEETQSYVEGKRQEAVKLYGEYIEADDDGKRAIKQIVRLSFANFDEGKLTEPLKTFIYNCKYN